MNKPAITGKVANAKSITQILLDKIHGDLVASGTTQPVFLNCLQEKLRMLARSSEGKRQGDKAVKKLELAIVDVIKSDAIQAKEKIAEVAELLSAIRRFAL